MQKRLSAMYCKRHDTQGKRGWQVQVPGHPSEFFSDSRHSGEAAAFRKARARATELADTDKVNLKTGRYVRVRGKRDGVFRVEVKGYAFWVAEWSPEPGKKKQARFSVGKWGERGAQQKAQETRREKLALVLDQ